MIRTLKSVLFGKFEPQQLERLIRSYDIVGDIAIIRVPNGLESESRVIGEAILQSQKHVKTVLQQVSAVSGAYRLRKLRWVVGENRTKTVHKESGCVFKVDLESCYFSPRLSFERMRIARLVQPDETVVNMFAGVGCFSVLMAKCGRARTVYSVDVNSRAVEYMRENIRLNRLQGRVVPVLGDAKDVIVRNLQGVADRVVMPLPEKAYAYLDYAVMALKASGGWIHYYDFEHAAKRENPMEKVEAKVAEKLRKLIPDSNVFLGRVVRSVGPNWYQVVLDIEVSRTRYGSHNN